jgi:hypothetical protein
MICSPWIIVAIREVMGAGFERTKRSFTGAPVAW